MAEDVPLDDRYRVAKKLLWTAPCDLPAARALVAEYQHVVRVAVGAEITSEERT